MLSVSPQRWRDAQAYELSTWKRQNSTLYRILKHVGVLAGKVSVEPGDDWNHWWREQFDNYRALPERIPAAIELGCGPYTNMRLILEQSRINRVVCSDPLAAEYLKLRHAWIAKEANRGSIEVDNSPIEDLPYADQSFDLVVLVNVLDHVRDADICLKKAISITRRGGYLVVGQDLTSDVDRDRVGPDVGHPIRLGRDDLDHMLTNDVESVYYRILERTQGRNPDAHYATYLTIGRRH